MTIGASGSYAINGTDLTLQPFSHHWAERDSFGLDGNAHVIYSSVRGYELGWPLMSMSDFQQIYNFYNAVQSTGTVSVDLPQWGASGYVFQRYSGCVLSEPTFDNFFDEFLEGVRLLITNIANT